MIRLIIGILFLSFSVSGCSGKGRDHHDHELEAQSVTKRGVMTELFSENKPLVAGQATSFAVHLTKLDDFKALNEGKVEIIFLDTQGNEFRFFAAVPTSPGIFRPVARIPSAGAYDLKLTVSGPVSDVYELGQIHVYKDAHEASHDAGHEESAGGISFLKEQQWKVDFNVEEVSTKELSHSLRTYGQVIAPSKTAVAVLSPIEGIVEVDVSGPPLFRAYVAQGQRLASVKSNDGQSVEIKSPISGIASRVHLTGAVQKDTRIFEIIDLSKVWVEAHVYESDVEKLGQIESALIEIPGSGKNVQTDRLIGEGGVFNASSRTLPVLFEIDNSNGDFRVGSAVTVHIKTGHKFNGPAIPKSAIVDEDGRSVVYLQIEGESFERREISIAVTDGEWTGVKDGLQKGEWVVTKGAYLVRLASSSSQIPAHGHAH